MPEILIASCPPVGHIAPLLNVARTLVARGDRVTVLTSARHADKIRAVGAEPRPLPYGADYDDSNLDADLPGRAETSGIPRLNFDIEHIFIRPLPHQFSALQELLADNDYDAVITDALFLGTLPLLLDPSAKRPPILTYSTTPLFLSSCDTAPGGPGITPMPGPIGRLRNRILQLATQKVLLRPAHRAADRMLETMGLPKLPVFVLEFAALADRVIVPTIPQFEYHRSDLPAHVRFVGAVNPLPSDNFIAPSWWSQLNDDRPVVHVTQGTVDNADLTRLVEPTIEALADEDVTVVVTTGGRPVSQIRTPLPANVFVAEYLPHDVLLPMVDVMVTNGGYGAVQRALSDGVPMVVAGQTEDKPEVAARVEYFGAGVNLRTGTPTVDDVRRAVRQVLDDDAYRSNARRLQNEYEAWDSASGIAAVVDEVIAENTDRLQTV
ncbi:nucleotide disphospho-sugar-binding domain-containing protein [Mycobacterium sp. 236(2023)]|uniref:glycosyltransferase n=1 Tax=Mycobacterium sp. 236(2023) TaxID=3038163 RepID=UPI002415268B|nr:nucleotide disphospho-sugar-binding domain-containing protein [Mycobacterium sp. 236(2023)]MDG4667768.1 glycosyltransferase [Mycobacterium sp. 236(2023)]